MTFSTDLFLEYKKRPGKAALARLLERHQDAVFTVCHHVLRHPQDAEDACQEVLLEVARQLDAIDDPERFAGWLYRAALHTALDAKRKRGRQRARDAASSRAAVVAAAAPEPAEALHEGLAGLDDASRALVVEHYFARRPLRELAAERGCSEVAVWKRIRHARERLRKSLGSAVVSALDGIGVVQAPGRLLGKALLRGGLSMAASGGIKLAIVAPLIMLAGTGVVMMARRPEPAAELAPAKTAAARRPLQTTSPSGSASASTMPATPLPARAPTASSAPRRPYPLKLPAAAARGQVAEQTWKVLHTKRMTIDEQDVPLPRLLQEISLESGLSIVMDPQIGEGETVSFKVQDIVVDGALRLMLQPRNKGYEIRPDGTVFVAPAERLSEETPEIKKVKEVLQELGSVRDLLDGGWDGLRDPDDESRKSKELLAKKISVPQGETSLREEISRLREEHDIYVFAPSSRGAGPGGGGGKPSTMDERFLQVVEEQTVGEHLEQLAHRVGLTLVESGAGFFFMTTADDAQSIRAQEERRKRQYQESLEVLEKPLPEAGTLFVQDLLESIPRSLGVELEPDEAVWENGGSVTLADGATLRDALDAIKAKGFRWALHRGKIVVLK